LAKRGEPKGRIPPHSQEAEMGVLGAILLSNDALNNAVEVLRPNEFYDPKHRLIFETMLELDDAMTPVDVITVAERLKAKGKLEEAGGGAHLARLTEAVPTAAHVVHHAQIVKNTYLSRELADRATKITEQCYESFSDVGDLLDSAEQSIFSLAEYKIKQAFFGLAEVVKSSLKRVEELYDRKELVTGVPTGFERLDRMTAGFQPSDLIIIAGRPSMGKTALALNIALYAAAEAETGVGVFSLEMSKEQLTMRLLCSEAKVDANSIRTGFIKEKDWPNLIQAADLLSRTPIYLDDTPAIDILEMRAKTRRLKKEHNIGLVVVDYLQLMQGRQGAERREQEISEISRSLKAMAKELNLPVVALSQLNRRVEERPNKRPQLADLRESGAIEQDADVILFIYRDEVYNKSPDNPEKGKAEIIVGKQRNGPTGLVKLRFDGRVTKFDNLDESHEGYQPLPVEEAPF